jgi:ubiquinone/menaquinone biosynthesis C-methylase UbiE
MHGQRHGDTAVIRHHWDARAGTFDDDPGHGINSDQQREAWLDLLARLAGRAPQRVLDVGCGTGSLALCFAELGHVVSGIDLSPEMIRQARRKAERELRQIDYRVGDAAALDLADETFDLVVARHVIWNLPDPERGVAEWLRVLRPGGRLVLIEGKWADNEALAHRNARPMARTFARVLDLAAVVMPGGRFRQRVLNKKYRLLESQLPFSGGPSANRLAEFLEAHSVRSVEVEPLMDPILWGEAPRFPRYVVTGVGSANEPTDR